MRAENFPNKSCIRRLDVLYFNKMIEGSETFVFGPSCRTA